MRPHARASGPGSKSLPSRKLQALRLTPEQSRAIVAATAELAGADARVRLFGSRLRDDLRGGDIDLLVECPHPVDRPVWLATQITARLQRALGDRKIDVLVIDPQTPLQPVHRVAQAEGVLLQA
jgi:predicted nucleotidyltransferase